VYFKDPIITTTTRVISVCLAATLLVGSILALYFVANDAARLGILLAFIITFAFGVATTTSASRDSIFAATAAYAAVLIVFISGDLSNSNSTMASTAALEQAIKDALASMSA
jgi:formate/nitrite transporter FocA (FNT family)